jgi:histidyl-tRNA synthetase
MRINNRKLLRGMIQFAGIPEEKVIDAFRSIDKLDKVGIEGVDRELEKRGISGEQKDKLLRIIGIRVEPKQLLEKTKELLENSQEASEGIEELQQLIRNLGLLGRDNIVIDLSLVRGLDYYTSTIFELSSSDESIGSLGGGGRYDQMIGTFAGVKEETPAVGIGIGIERIIELIKEREKSMKKTLTNILVINVNQNARKDCLEIAQKFRKSGIKTQTDIMGRSLSGQLEYANSLGIPYVLVVGPKELESGKFTLKDMQSGEEEKLTLEEIVEELG